MAKKTNNWRIRKRYTVEKCDNDNRRGQLKKDRKTKRILQQILKYTQIQSASIH